MIASPQIVEGLRLAVSDRGEGQPVLFQHGLCGDARQPADVFPLERWRCVTVECRGHGASEPGDPRDFGIARFAEDIATILDAAALGPIVVGGISMGAAIALRLAVLRPDLVAGLILARPAWVTEAAPANMRPNAVVGELLTRLGPEAARAEFERSATAAELAVTGPDNLTSLRGFFDRRPLEITAALLSRLSADGPGISPEQVRAIGVPTLVLGHARDVVHPLAHARALANLVPGARLVTITPKAEDLTRYRDEFRGAIADFLIAVGR